MDQPVDVSGEAVIAAYRELGALVSPGDYFRPDGADTCGCALGVLAVKHAGIDSVRWARQRIGPALGSTDRALGSLIGLDPDFAVGYGYGFWQPGSTVEHVMYGERCMVGNAAGVVAREAVDASDLPRLRDRNKWAL
jgi:hypothetical protein